MWLEVVVVVVVVMGVGYAVGVWVGMMVQGMEERVCAKFDAAGMTVGKPGVYVMDEVEAAGVEQRARATSRERGVAAGWRRWSAS